MAKKRPQDGSNPRLHMDYREYMKRYQQQHRDEAPAAEEAAPPIQQSAPSITETPPAEPEQPIAWEAPIQAPSEPDDEAIEDVTRAPTYKEQRQSAPEADDDEDEDEDDPDALDVQNPFMDMYHRAKYLTKKASELIGLKKDADDDAAVHFTDDEDEDELYEPEESGWTRFLAKIGFKPLGDDDLDEDELRSKYRHEETTPPPASTANEPSYHRSFEQSTGKIKIVEEIDPIFTMDDTDYSSSAFEAPDRRSRRREKHETEDAPVHDLPLTMSKKPERTYQVEADEYHETINREEADDMAGEGNKDGKRYEELLGYETSETPSMSRRERKSRETMGGATSTRKYQQTKSEPKIPNFEDIRGVDEPTQEFKPVRVRPEPARTEPEVEPYFDQYDEYEEEIKPAPSSKFGRRGKQRVYSDYDDEYEEEEYDAEYDDDYEDYDYDDEDEDDDERNSLGRHILGFLKALFAIIIILVVLLIAMRLLENAGIVKLDAVRDTLGKYVPIEMILPKPETAAEPEASSPEASTEETQSEDTTEYEDWGLPTEGENPDAQENGQQDQGENTETGEQAEPLG